VILTPNQDPFGLFHGMTSRFGGDTYTIVSSSSRWRRRMSADRCRHTASRPTRAITVSSLASGYRSRHRLISTYYQNAPVAPLLWRRSKSLWPHSTGRSVRSSH